MQTAEGCRDRDPDMTGDMRGSAAQLAIFAGWLQQTVFNLRVAEILIGGNEHPHEAAADGVPADGCINMHWIIAFGNFDRRKRARPRRARLPRSGSRWAIRRGLAPAGARVSNPPRKPQRGLASLSWRREGDLNPR